VDANGGALDEGEHLPTAADAQPPTQKPGTLMQSPSTLPIASHRQRIVRSTLENVITVVHGETGCGKSSQVPKFLVSAARQQAEEKQAEEEGEPGSAGGDLRPTFIVVTQPRRIAAITLARRVAEELGEQVGETVGYAIGQDRCMDQGEEESKAMFVTGGWLLQKLLFNVDFFHRCTHLVLDEIHERSIDSDLLYLLVRQMLLHSLREGLPTPRIVLMSATFNSGMFARYFGPCNVSVRPRRMGLAPSPEDLAAFSNPKPIDVLFVGVKRYPVDVVQSDQLADHPLLRSGQVCLSHDSLSKLEQKFRPGMKQLAPQAAGQVQREVAVELCLALAAIHVHQRESTCVLVFLPGLFDIETLYGSLTEAALHSGLADWVEILILHSLLEHDDQMRAFKPIEEVR
jgi:HrpA-like RNA helicase